TLRQDYGKNNLPEIEKYDGFCIICLFTYNILIDWKAFGELTLPQKYKCISENGKYVGVRE
ncbi:MAG: hypothetical protein Q8T08_19560, partial [Ignavibacteria bacterium]|nr:hypothetical protein [Ignavibacteria bacterium]